MTDEALIEKMVEAQKAAPIPIHDGQPLDVYVASVWSAYARAALAVVRAEQALEVEALLDGIRSAERLTDELEDAWRSGYITENDGRGGTRSNRNTALNRHLRSLLAPFERK